MEGSKVARVFVEFALVVTDVKVECCVARTTGELFCEVLRDGRYSGVLDGYLVEGFEAMDDPQAAVLLEDAKPTGPIRRVRRFVDSGFDLLLDEGRHFLVDPRWYGEVLLDPWHMVDDRELNTRKHVASEGSSFVVVPCESFVLLAHHVV